MTTAFLIAVFAQLTDQKKWDAYCDRRDSVRQSLQVKTTSLEKELELAQRGRVLPRSQKVLPKKQEGKPPAYRSAEDKERDIARIKKDITDYKRLAREDLPLSFEHPNVGDIGTLIRPVKIIQVTGEGSCIARTDFFGGEFTIWIDVSTKGFLDGEEYKLSGLFEFAGTKTYNTALGSSKTVRHVRAFVPPKDE